MVIEAELDSIAYNIRFGKQEATQEEVELARIH